MGLIFSAIITSGCTTTNKFVSPLCIGSPPMLSIMSIEEQTMIRDYDPDLLFRIANNTMLLVEHIAFLQRTVAIYNEQFEAECS